jgi:hypothetical protein
MPAQHVLVHVPVVELPSVWRLAERVPEFELFGMLPFVLLQLLAHEDVIDRFVRVDERYLGLVLVAALEDGMYNLRAGLDPLGKLIYPIRMQLT